MIVVLGSRHDRVARSLVEALPSARLCSAEDLTRPGWVWPLASDGSARWIVDGRPVDDSDVTGVLVRRTCVYPEELIRTHPLDREYLAAESTAFLAFVLSRTAARVVNPVVDGAFGEHAVQPERWMPMASGLGLHLAPLRFKAADALGRRERTTTVEVVGGDSFGDAPAVLRAGATVLAARAGLVYATFVYDEEDRLMTISTGGVPGEAAIRALGSLLGARGCM